jgi:nucleoside-diphosphate-sugar epimerase
MKALVTGAGGFTGRALALRLLERGDEVVALARDASSCSDLADRGAAVVAGDIRDSSAADRAVVGVGVVYHIAALFRRAGFPDSEYREVNVEGTRTLLDASIRAGVGRFVHCSTIGVCGDITSPPADEETPYNPGDIYQVTKMEGEKLALSYAREGRLPVSVARPASIYGPGDLRLLKMFRMIKKGTFFVVGSGRPGFHVVYIDDLVDGFVLCAEKDGAVGEVFILAGSEYVELNELFRIVAETLGVKPPWLHLPVLPVQMLGTLAEKICIPLGIEPPIYRRRVDFFTKSRAFSIDKARRTLGYSPRVDLRTGISRTAEWYRREKLL